MNANAWKRWLRVGLLLGAAFVVGYVGIWQWTICRVYVPPGNSLRLRYKGPFPFNFRNVKQAPEGTLAPVDAYGRPAMIGILEVMPGPGRHFYSPLEYERTIVPDLVIEPGELGIVNSKVGKELPHGVMLADEPGYHGVWRRVLTPGRYRMNSYAYSVEKVPVSQCVSSPAGPRGASDKNPTLIGPGYVGVVTNRVSNPATKETQGIQENVLQPGIYFLNPHEKQVNIISIGYNETTLTAATQDAANDRLGKLGAKDPQFIAGQGIEYPSNDGFTIHMDYTAIWGILPDQAPDVVYNFGTLKDVEQKIILPQIGSICRLFGSKRGAVDLLVGDMREEFQTDTAEELERVLASKNLTLLFGLTRHIYVPSQVREPIQKKNIADELKLTADQMQLTLKAKADLTEATAKVMLEERRTMAETGKLVAEAKAQGEKNAREIEAETEKLKAEIGAKTAEIEAQITTTLGEADAKKTELKNEAVAERFKQYVQALGGPDAYNRYVFAEGLPEDMKLGIFYAGPGTFWTDLKGFEQVMLGKLGSETLAPGGVNTVKPRFETPAPKP